MDNKDINIDLGDYILNCRAVAVIKNDNNILLQKRKQDKFWALPGGKVKLGEQTKNTIERELAEELGIHDYEIIKMDSVTEYFFKFDGKKIHQYIFSFLVEIKEQWIFNKKEFLGIEKEKNLIYKWFDISEIEKGIIKPDFLKEHLLSKDESVMKFISYKEE